MSASGVALRIAYRDALAHKVRSLLVILLVGLPVLVVTVGLVIGRTAHVDAVERMPRELGHAAAKVEATTAGPINQVIDPHNHSWSGDLQTKPPTVDDLRSVLGPDAEVTTSRSGSFRARVDGEVHWTELREFDFASDLTEPFYDLAEGTVPAAADEVVVNGAFAEAFGVALGDVIQIPGLAATPRLVGIAESASTLSPIMMGPVNSIIGAEVESEFWLVDSGPVTWDDVVALNQFGFVVTSRAVLTDPPTDSELSGDYADYYMYDESIDEVLAVTALIVVMVLLEVALLAGPALAVTARQQSRTLALVTAAGGTPRQARAVVIAQGAVLGLGAAVIGAVLGVVIGVLALPIAQRFDGTPFGPVDIPWLWILGVVLAGAVAILVAAIVPAWITAKQDPVRALAGRRADGNPHVGSPILGLALIAVGVVATVMSAQGMGFPEIGIAASTIVIVLGALLVLPVIVVTVAKLAADLPLPFRFAARDASRHRGRTVPAIAAVAATVAGVVGVGIANASQAARDEANYGPMLPYGESVVTWSPSLVGAEKAVPGSEVASEATEIAEQLGLAPEPVLGLAALSGDDYDQSWSFRSSGQGEPIELYGYSGWGSTAIQADDTDLVVGLTAAERAEIESELDAERAVVIVNPFDSDVSAAAAVQPYDLVLTETNWNGEEAPEELFRASSVPTTVIEVEGRTNATLLIPSALAASAELPAKPVALRFAEELTAADAKDLSASLEVLDDRVSTLVYTERGYEDLGQSIVNLVLVAAGGLLMLVGTLTATFLALSDARPDLATMGAVGASPRRRRSIGGAYALLIAGVGAVIGTLIGLVPGITAGYVTTIDRWGSGLEGPFVEIPWLTLVIVLLGLPLLTAGVVWASARSKIPMVARID